MLNTFKEIRNDILFKKKKYWKAQRKNKKELWIINYVRTETKMLIRRCRR